MSNPFTQATIFSLRLIPDAYTIPVFTSQTGAFLTFAVLAAVVATIKNKDADKEEAAAKAAKIEAAKKAAAAKGAKA